jgi:hypothetical protein
MVLSQIPRRQLGVFMRREWQRAAPHKGKQSLKRRSGGAPKYECGFKDHGTRSFLWFVFEQCIAVAAVAHVVSVGCVCLACAAQGPGFPAGCV